MFNVTFKCLDLIKGTAIVYLHVLYKESGKLEYQSPNVQMQFGYDHVNFVDKKHQVSYGKFGRLLLDIYFRLVSNKTQNGWTKKAPFFVSTHLTPGKMDGQNWKMLSWKKIRFLRFLKIQRYKQKICLLEHNKALAT